MSQSWSILPIIIISHSDAIFVPAQGVAKVNSIYIFGVSSIIRGSSRVIIFGPCTWVLCIQVRQSVRSHTFLVSFLVSAEGRKLMKRICLSVSVSMKTTMKNIVSARDIYDLSSENDYVWEKPDT